MRQPASFWCLTSYSMLLMLAGMVLISAFETQMLGQTPAFSIERSSKTRPNRITEAPSPLPGAQQNSFSLSSLPASPHDVHLFLKGVELIPGKDYLLEDKIITVLDLPPGTDLRSLLVYYQTQFLEASTSQNLLWYQQAAINRAIIGVAKLDGSENNRHSREEEEVLASSGTQQFASHPSLSLLARTLREAEASRSSTLAGYKRRRQSPHRGFDGLGDSVLNNDYSLLLGTSVAGGSRQLIAPQNTITAQPLSLIMLQRRIDEAPAK